MLTHVFVGASFDNWLDAVDGSFCTFEGGDVPGFVGYRQFCHRLTLILHLRMGFIQTLSPEASQVCLP